MAASASTSHNTATVSLVWNNLIPTQTSASAATLQLVFGDAAPQYFVNSLKEPSSGFHPYPLSYLEPSSEGASPKQTSAIEESLSRIQNLALSIGIAQHTAGESATPHPIKITWTPVAISQKPLTPYHHYQLQVASCLQTGQILSTEATLVDITYRHPITATVSVIWKGPMLTQTDATVNRAPTQLRLEIGNHLTKYFVNLPNASSSDLLTLTCRKYWQESYTEEQISKITANIQHLAEHFKLSVGINTSDDPSIDAFAISWQMCAITRLGTIVPGHFYQLQVSSNQAEGQALKIEATLVDVTEQHQAQERRKALICQALQPYVEELLKLFDSQLKKSRLSNLAQQMKDVSDQTKHCELNRVVQEHYALLPDAVSQAYEQCIQILSTQQDETLLEEITPRINLIATHLIENGESMFSAMISSYLTAVMPDEIDLTDPRLTSVIGILANVYASTSVKQMQDAIGTKHPSQSHVSSSILTPLQIQQLADSTRSMMGLPAHKAVSTETSDVVVAQSMTIQETGGVVPAPPSDEGPAKQEFSSKQIQFMMQALLPHVNKVLTPFATKLSSLRLDTLAQRMTTVPQPEQQEKLTALIQQTSCQLPQDIFKQCQACLQLFINRQERTQSMVTEYKPLTDYISTHGEQIMAEMIRSYCQTLIHEQPQGDNAQIPTAISSLTTTLAPLFVRLLTEMLATIRQEEFQTSSRSTTGGVLSLLSTGWRAFLDLFNEEDDDNQMRFG